MSGNGTDPHYATAARLASSLGKPGPMSAAEREQQRIAYIAAVDGMATVLKALDQDVGTLKARVKALEWPLAQGRYDARKQLQNMSLMARLRWLVLGR